jgi:hypothetical protein
MPFMMRGIERPSRPRELSTPRAWHCRGTGNRVSRPNSNPRFRSGNNHPVLAAPRQRRLKKRPAASRPRGAPCHHQDMESPPAHPPRSQTPFGNVLSSETLFREGAVSRWRTIGATDCRGQQCCPIDRFPKQSLGKRNCQAKRLALIRPAWSSAGRPPSGLP